MAAPTQLFLTQNEIDGKFKIIDENDFPYGDAYEIPDAIQHARMVTDAPISIGESHAGFDRQCVSEKPLEAIADSEVFIQALAEIGGMKVTKLFDDNMHFIGYTMELAEDTFVEAELAAEAHENEVVNALGSYMEDD